METRIWGISDEDLKEAGEALRNGKIVAFPTETVYGLGANAFDEKAVKAVYRAKGRPSDNPMIVHIYSVSQIGDLTPAVTQEMRLLAAEFWPGPLTMVVPKKAGLPDVTTGGLSSVGLRLPSSEAARRLIAFAGCPVAAPSANLSGSPSPTTASHVRKDLLGRIDGLVEGENCDIGIESTVVDLTGDIPTVLRPGYITVQELENCLSKLGKAVEIDKHIQEMQDLSNLSFQKKDIGKTLNSDKPELQTDLTEKLTDDLYMNADFKPKAPGMKYRHYAPKAELILVIGDYESAVSKMRQMKTEYEQKGKKVELTALSDSEADIKLEMLTFFEKLRKYDENGADIIIARGHNQENGRAYAIMNRMLKASGYNIVKA